MGANKAIGSGVAGSLTIILVWVMGLFHVQVPPEVAASMTAVIGTAVVYVVPHGNGGS